MFPGQQPWLLQNQRHRVAGYYWLQLYRRGVEPQPCKGEGTTMGGRTPSEDLEQGLIGLRRAADSYGKLWAELVASSFDPSSIQVNRDADRVAIADLLRCFSAWVADSFHLTNEQVGHRLLTHDGSVARLIWGVWAPTWRLPWADRTEVFGDAIVLFLEGVAKTRDFRLDPAEHGGSVDRFGAWLHSIWRRIRCKACRRHRDSVGGQALLAGLPAPDTDPGDRLERREIRRIVLYAIEQIEDLRIRAILHNACQPKGEQVTDRSLAQSLGVSPSRICQLRKEGHRQLRISLGPLWRRL